MGRRYRKLAEEIPGPPRISLLRSIQIADEWIGDVFARIRADASPEELPAMPPTDRVDAFVGFRLAFALDELPQSLDSDGLKVSACVLFLNP